MIPVVFLVSLFVSFLDFLSLPVSFPGISVSFPVSVSFPGKVMCVNRYIICNVSVRTIVH